MKQPRNRAGGDSGLCRRRPSQEPRVKSAVRSRQHVDGSRGGAAGAARCQLSGAWDAQHGTALHSTAQHGTARHGDTRPSHSARDEAAVTRRQDPGVTIALAPQPLHYYALLSWTAEGDVFVSIVHGHVSTVHPLYSGNRHEVECKCSQYVTVRHSRPVWPRTNMPADGRTAVPGHRRNRAGPPCGLIHGTGVRATGSAPGRALYLCNHYFKGKERLPLGNTPWRLMRTSTPSSTSSCITSCIISCITSAMSRVSDQWSQLGKCTAPASWVASLQREAAMWALRRITAAERGAEGRPRVNRPRGGGGPLSHGTLGQHACVSSHYEGPDRVVPLPLRIARSGGGARHVDDDGSTPTTATGSARSSGRFRSAAAAEG